MNKAYVCKSIVTALLAGSALQGSAAYAQAQTPVDPPSATTLDDKTDADIVVTGIRRSLEDALRTKRDANQVLDSISADSIGKLPDQNLAESLQRLPGVQINRSAQRRLGTVSIRGLPGDFSQTLINGQYLASPDVSNFSFGTVRSEVFSGVDVIKSDLPSNLTGGLSGLVNLRTGSPLEGRNQLTVTVDGKYEALTEDVAPGGAIVFQRQFVPGVFGIRAAFGYQRLNFREDNAQINTYDRIAGAATTDTADDVFIPKQTRLATNETKGNSYSAALTAEWRPIPSLTATVRGFYNDYQPRAYTSQFTIDTTAGRTVRTPVGAALSEGSLGQTYTDVIYTNPVLIADSRILDDRYRTYAVTGELKWENGGWLVDGTLHYTKAKRTSANFGYQAQQSAAATGTNGLTVEINTGAADINRFLYDLTTGSPRFNLEQAFTAPAAGTYRQVNAVANPLQNFIGGFRNNSENEDELAVQFMIRRDINFGPFKNIEFGGVYRDKYQDQFNALQSLFGTNIAALNNSVYNFSFLRNSDDFLGGRGRFDPFDYAEIDVDRVTRLLTPVTATTLPANSAIGPGGLVAIQDSTSIAQLYENKQKIYGGYGQIALDQAFGDFHLRGIVGARYEKSERSTIARTSTNQPTAPLAFKYDNWLPSANLSIEAWGNLVLRGSYNKTLRRPQVDSFAVLRSIAVDGTGTLVTVNLGASDLRPFTTDNFDLSLEWYNRAGSNISVNLFKKNVHDYAGTVPICPADGGGFGFGPLSVASGGCRTTQATPASGTLNAVATNAVVNINVTSNQSTFTLKGFEISAQQNLSFLPAPWKYFGAQVNYTYIDFASSTSFRLSEISRDTVNAILYYETPRFSLRGAFNYRSGYFLNSIGTVSGAARLIKARPQLDLTGSLNVTDHLSATAEIFNVTDAVLYEYEATATRARNYSIYGRTVQFGLSYKF